ncbi:MULTISPECIES: hypothetical protein [Xanthomonas]|uniref:hypothetical protein n=1 Tax=Xanthomonas TaxID=338 RepID=UPI000531133E|nr:MULTISPECIES: hypothetical protein [Xanthomonas]OOW85047.1 hypothetical protein Xvtw_13280 [Xanthomonas campestris pv. vitiswoodrowii]OOX22122.1 hypothetical protein Xazr_21780 [Xanthomonas campestris pv. azadirachtae]AZR35222.1 hypothetical protein NX08_012860 [Xanthomonas vasicola]KGR52564.1 hypothetical protein NX09_16570 [Xanthomonas vasicola]KGT83477.1 hypothetical protein OC00_13585 [Xanthomonas vasicola]
MKYIIEINATVQVAHYMTVEASSPQEALAQCDVDAVADSEFTFEDWFNEPKIDRIEDATGKLIACNYEDEVPDIGDL